MAITSTLLTSGKSTTPGTVFTTASIAPAGNKLIKISVSSSSTASGDNVVPSISGNGLTWEDINNSETEIDWGRISVKRGMVASPSSGVVTITFSAAQDDCLWEIREWSGIDTSGAHGSGAIVQSANNQAEATSLTVTLGAFGNANNATFGAFGKIGVSGEDGDQTPGSGFSELLDDWNIPSYVNGIHSIWRNDNDTTVDSSQTDSVFIGGVAIEIKAAAVGGVSANDEFYKTLLAGGGL